MELLSPAGNREALIAAIACGADAVYLGYTAFGARSYAGNFDADGLHEAVEYAHERGKKIWICFLASMWMQCLFRTWAQCGSFRNTIPNWCCMQARK